MWDRGVVIRVVLGLEFNNTLGDIFQKHYVGFGCVLDVGQVIWLINVLGWLGTPYVVYTIDKVQDIWRRIQ